MVSRKLAVPGTNKASGGFLRRSRRSSKNLANQGVLHVADPLIAANHFAGLLFWILMNKAMFGIAHSDSNRDAELECYATMAVRAFLNGYGRA